MAQAVSPFDDTKLAIEPTIENGFYYDFDLEHTITPEDLQIIEAEMTKIAKRRFTYNTKRIILS